MIDDMPVEKDTPRNHGKMAFLMGLRITDNPYPSGSMMNYSWNMGWVIERNDCSSLSTSTMRFLTGPK